MAVRLSQKQFDYATRVQQYVMNKQLFYFALSQFCNKRNVNCSSLILQSRILSSIQFHLDCLIDVSITTHECLGIAIRLWSQIPWRRTLSASKGLYPCDVGYNMHNVLVQCSSCTYHEGKRFSTIYNLYMCKINIVTYVWP